MKEHVPPAEAALSEVKVIDDPEIARFFSNTDQFTILHPFLMKACSLSEAAESLNMKLNTLHYHVKKLLAWGLLVLDHEEARQGRAIKYYRSSHPAYFVPFHISPFEDLQDLLTRILSQGFDILATSFARKLYDYPLPLGIRVFATSDTHVHIDLTDPEGNLNDDILRRVWQEQGLLNINVGRLKQADALQLKADLEEIYQRYSAKVVKDTDEAAIEYIYLMGMCPTSLQ